MTALIGGLLIFALRIVDVSIGTVKLLYVVRGMRGMASALAFVEALVWLTAAGLVFSQLDNLWNGVCFAAGFAAGTMCGMTIERWIGSGYMLLRIVTRDKEQELLDALKDQGFGLTMVQGRGAQGSVTMVMAVIRRRRRAEALALIQRIDPNAFITADPVNPASGGYIVPGAIPSNIRK